MYFRNGYVIDPPEFLQPAYSISPFSRHESVANSHLSGKSALHTYLGRRFNGKSWYLTLNARSAIGEILKHLGIRKEENVAIFTTSDNAYISGCVTREIECHCGWRRGVDSSTKVILVNHEFGFPREKITQLKAYGIPIIEDLAHSFFSDNSDRTAGTIGDFLVFSFPKMFPVQMGGLLVAREPIAQDAPLDQATEDYLCGVVGHHVHQEDKIRERRRANHAYLEARFGELGCTSRFKLEPFHVPGVFMFRMDRGFDLESLKSFFQANGVESSVFYPENTFFIPVHQELKPFDLDYFFTLASVFVEGKHGII